jgi:catalase
MPLPNDERVIALANDILAVFDAIFGLHPGYRPVHAKGHLLTGTFTPTAAAASLSNAPHFTRPSTPVTARFSDSTGIPVIPDNDGNANPRGFALRFNLADHVHTDIVSQSTDAFPARNGNEFVQFLRAVAASGPDVPSPKPVEIFVSQHPGALAFVTAPKPFAKSFAKFPFYAVSAFKFTNAEGKVTHGRYRILPEGGEEYFSDAEAAGLSPNYHFEEIAARVKAGPVRFHIFVQIAAEGDVTDDPTVRWPENRQLVDIGTIELNELVADNATEQQHIIFDPIPRVAGIEPSDDPLFELRAAIYLISGRRRRSAPPTPAS